MILKKQLLIAGLCSAMIGLKSPQFSWLKGGAETAKKLLPHIWSSDLSLSKKIHASTHLLGSSVFLFVFVLGVFSVPLLYVINPMQIDTKYLSVFLVSLLSVAAVYYVANVETAWDNQNKFKSVLSRL